MGGEIRKRSPVIGAEICGVDLSKPVARETFEQIHQIWLDHNIIRAPILWRLPGRSRRSLSMSGIQTDH